MKRIFTTKILKIVEEKQKINYHLFKGAWQFDEISLGWFVHLDGSRERIKVGDEKPEDLQVGDTMRVTLEKTDAER